MDDTTKALRFTAKEDGAYYFEYLKQRPELRKLRKHDSVLVCDADIVKISRLVSISEPEPDTRNYHSPYKAKPTVRAFGKKRHDAA